MYFSEFYKLGTGLACSFFLFINEQVKLKTPILHWKISHLSWLSFDVKIFNILRKLGLRETWTHDFLTDSRYTRLANVAHS